MPEPTGLALDQASIPRHHTWSLVLRGILALAAAAILLALPASGLVAILALFIALFAFDGIVSIVMGIWHIRSDRRWWASILQGVVSLGIAALGFFWPMGTLLAMVWLAAVWLIWEGISELLMSRVISHGAGWMIFAGLLSVGLGIIMIAVPAAGKFGLVGLVAGFFFLRGLSLLGVAFGRRRDVGRLAAS